VSHPNGSFLNSSLGDKLFSPLQNTQKLPFCHTFILKVMEEKCP
jgi:hypothetical protein